MQPSTSMTTRPTTTGETTSAYPKSASIVTEARTTGGVQLAWKVPVDPAANSITTLAPNTAADRWLNPTCSPRPSATATPCQPAIPTVTASVSSSSGTWSSMQFYQDLQGNRTPLPAPSIDTGMGLERAAAVLQNKRNLYETDLFQPIVEGICNLTDKEYGVDTDTDYAIRVVAEHGRGVSFLIADGVVPGNEGRGYVLRRIIRRAIRYGRLLGLEEPFLTEVASIAIQRFQNAYPELSENREHIIRVISLEEERFAQTFERGFVILSDLIESRKGLQNGAHRVSGQETFNLYDTYGFPPELTAEIAREHGLQVDMEGFDREMEAQRQQSVLPMLSKVRWRCCLPTKIWGWVPLDLSDIRKLNSRPGWPRCLRGHTTAGNKYPLWAMLPRGNR